MREKGPSPLALLTPTLWGDAPPLTIEPSTARPALSLLLADDAQTRWANKVVSRFHYLRAQVDPRCSVLAYIVALGGQHVGCLMFGRPEATNVGGWYGSVEEKMSGTCRLSRWEILNLARVWLSPSVQTGGRWYSPDLLPGFFDRNRVFHARLATTVIRMALEIVVIDYLIQYVPVWTSEPYQVREILSYCNPRYHRGVVYQQAGFRLERESSRGLQTYVFPARELTPGEDAYIRALAKQSPRSKRLRAQRASEDAQSDMRSAGLFPGQIGRASCRERV